MNCRMSCFSCSAQHNTASYTDELTTVTQHLDIDGTVVVIVWQTLQWSARRSNGLYHQCSASSDLSAGQRHQCVGVAGVDCHSTGAALLEVDLHPAKAAISVEERSEVVVLHIIRIAADLERHQLPAARSTAHSQMAVASTAAACVAGAATTSVKCAVVVGIVRWLVAVDI